MGIIHSLSDIDWFEWNGAKCTNYGMHVLQQPSYIRPAERVEYKEIPGRAGSLTLLEGEDVYDDISLACTCVIDDPQGDILAGSGRNLLKNSSFSENFDGWYRGGASIGPYQITTDDGYKCAHVDAISSGCRVSQNIIDMIKNDPYGQLYRLSADVKVENYVAGATNPYIQLYADGHYYNDNGVSTWVGPTDYTALSRINGLGWTRVSHTFSYKHPVDIDANIMLHSGNCTADLYFKNLKLEKGPYATDWTPAPEDLPVVEASRVASICSWLRGYGKVKFATDDTGYYEARVENQISFDKIVAGNPHRSFQVQFRCKPFRRLDSGDTTITVSTSPYTLKNLGNVPSLPLLKVYAGSSDVTDATIMIGSSTMIINSLEKNSYIMIDCEAKKAYRGSRGSASDPLTLLGTRVTGEWMKIPTGTSYVSFTGGISKIEITPRWRCLG